MIGPVLLHEEKTTETYSTFSGVLRTLEPDLRNVMAFGTDDERALVDGFKNNCSIVADIFGKTTGTVRESGLTDANDREKFLNMFWLTFAVKINHWQDKAFYPCWPLLLFCIHNYFIPPIVIDSSFDMCFARIGVLSLLLQHTSQYFFCKMFT